ncbi:MAG: RdgB/HAM1 family non-canonical purine NTP pyrophosphatase [Clostridiales bacterium]|nr:RdgB/HAM1 family non-canonical purine NTP pyrophosphatase [Clostridiales bacterium]
MKWVVATNNKNKLRELREILSGVGIEAVSLRDAGLDLVIEENAETYEENSLIKAKAVYDITGMAAIADDSGLEVYALNNAPGVHSARYAALDGKENATDEENLNKLLFELRDVPKEARGGKFISCIACVLGKNRSFTLRGECEGEITFERRGEAGFGYDPVFYVPSMGKTYSEMTSEEKNSISHRGRALLGLEEKLRELKDRGEI